MGEQKDKRVLLVELDDDVKKVFITGKDSDEKVVMRQELDEDDLDLVYGGVKNFTETIDEGVDLSDLTDIPGRTAGWGNRDSRLTNEIDPVQSHVVGNANRWE